MDGTEGRNQEEMIDVMVVYEWRYGANGRPGHRPQPNYTGICVACGPDGSICGRGTNRRGPLLRHNPKPYGRSMKYHRRRQ